MDLEQAIQIEEVEIDQDSIGERWATIDINRLSRIIAIVAMGQSAKAEIIIRRMQPAKPAITHTQLIDEAIRTLSIQEAGMEIGSGYPVYQRDGFIFEVISWIAAQQKSSENSLLKEPHTRSTTQGLDGLQLDLSEDRQALDRVVIFEDKCTENPRNTFRSKVIPAFIERHKNTRSAELVSTASELIRMAGLSAEDATRVSADVLNLTIRSYRSAFAVPAEYDNQDRRALLFDRFKSIEDIAQKQRIGATFVIDSDLREWFQELAITTIAYLNSLKSAEHV